MRFPTMWYVQPAKPDQSLCKSLEYFMNVKLLTKHQLAVLSLKGGYTGSSQYSFVKMPHCCKSHVAAPICFIAYSYIEAWIKETRENSQQMP